MEGKNSRRPFGWPSVVAVSPGCTLNSSGKASGHQANDIRISALGSLGIIFKLPRWLHRAAGVDNHCFKPHPPPAVSCPSFSKWKARRPLGGRVSLANGKARVRQSHNWNLNFLTCCSICIYHLQDSDECKGTEGGSADCGPDDSISQASFLLIRHLLCVLAPLPDWSSSEQSHAGMLC